MHAAFGPISSGFSDLAVPFGASQPEKGNAMRKTALILALAIALPAWAQGKPAADDKAAAPQEKPAEQAAAPQEAAKETPKAPRKAAGKKHSRRNEDARHCLDEPNNEAIIKCAEAYL